MVIPRIVIAGTSSGAGKTTIATGIMAALSNVAAFKVGPDFIDPSYHALATGRPGRNLDAFLSTPELIAPLVRHGSKGADIAVIEGVMGLYDGASGRGELASTAHVAKLLQAPVVLVVNCEAMARSVAAIVHGYRTFDPDVNVAGVILNRVGSSFHADILREALPDIPVLGALHRDANLEVPERHLGLVPVAERAPRARRVIEHLGEAVKQHLDLDALVKLAQAAPELPGDAWAPREETAKVRVAIARGPAFSFHYQENLELLAGAGAELAEFDPLHDEALPEADALILAGGFPEVFGSELSANTALREEIARFDGPILAECGGLLYLAETLDERPMCGVLPVEAHMGDRLTLGYREATSLSDHPVWPAGTTTRGHEFHYSKVSAAGNAWEHQRGREGHVQGNVHASYLHTHWAATPEVADRLVAACG
ncbi:hydrogenobyrinic acid a,c-diamide synthase (glutamine-hydrolysing) /cobyrinate a,c-diamide synthase [Solirubrobacter pauli]|uniref:Hydrogenobyrinate a,c-diamide synthase n=1 Tax=Solirubrobacter pauli TaxID=166793 RepID=A0A660KX60_9ACTN|nr:hydrogenobyrinic acid a,c-diamide synthase (glutamine-hydrolysing) /cobyrinate a,c-diamide synthase [Solirubrobacter pauli]